MKVALTAEGTYPHQFGGVSVWCDQLIRGMSEYRFQLVALVGSGAEPVRWSLPSNVASLTTIPLWGPPPPVPWRARLRRGRPLPPVRELIDVLLAPPGQAQARFTDLMREIFAYAQRQDLSAALASDDAVRMLSEAWRERFPPERSASLNDYVHRVPGVREMPNGHGAVYAQNGRDPIGNGRRGQAGHLAGGSVRAAPTLHDAVIAMQLIEHALRPLSHPPVEADLVHVVTNGLGVLPALAAKWRHGTPMLVSEHGVYIREQYMHLRHPPFAWPVKELFLRFVRLICALGYQEAGLIAPGNVYNKRWEEQLGADPSRLQTVYNGVDPVEFPMLHEEPGVPTISWVGRIDPVKDLETLLLAFSQVLKEMPEARLRMFGSPARGREKYLEGCQALAADLGISEQATFEGRVRRVRDAYQAGHVVVLCSITEGFPYALIEAMTCGRPCVGTDVGGVREALADTGIVVPPRNPAVLAQACLRLLRDASLRRDMGAAARQRALELFTVDRTISTFDEIYQLLASGQGAAGRAAPVTDAAQDPAGSASDAGAWDEVGPWPWENGSRNLYGQDDTDIMPPLGNRSPAGRGPDEIKDQSAQAEVESAQAEVQLRHGETWIWDGEAWFWQGEPRFWLGEAQPAQAEVESAQAEVQLWHGEAQLAQAEPDQAEAEPAEAQVESAQAEAELWDGEARLKHGEAQPAQAEMERAQTEVESAQAEVQLRHGETWIWDGEAWLWQGEPQFWLGEAQPAQAEVESAQAEVQLWHGEARHRHGEAPPARVEAEQGRAGAQFWHGEARLKHGEAHPAQAEVEAEAEAEPAQAEPGPVEASGLQPQEPAG